MELPQIGRILLGVSAVSLIIMFIKADVLDRRHIFNPAWPEHARFHAVMDVYVSAGIGVLVLFLLIKYADRTPVLALSALLLLLVETGFIAAALAVGPEGSAPPGTPTVVLGIKPNVILAIALIVVTITGYYLA